MMIADIMTRNVEVVRPDASIREAARKMDQLNVGILPVCDGERLVGVITDRDIVVRSTAAGDPPDSTRIRTVMTDEARWCFEDASVEDAERLMSEAQIRRLPVVNHEKRLVGIVSLGDLATDHAPGADEALRRVSEPSEPDRSGIASSRAADEGPHGRGVRRRRDGAHSDEELLRAVTRGLRDHPDLDATNIKATVDGGAVTLNGTVAGTEDKLRAEVLAESIPGVKRVENALEIHQDVTMGNPSGIAASPGPGGREPPTLRK